MAEHCEPKALSGTVLPWLAYKVNTYSRVFTQDPNTCIEYMYS